MKYRVTHRTVYEYTEPVTVSHHAARLKPRVTPGQHREHWNLTIRPEPALRKMRTDYFGNRVCSFSVQELHTRLEIEATSEVRVEPALPADPGLSPPWDEVALGLREPGSEELLEAYPFVFESPHVRPSPELAALGAPVFGPGRPLLEAVRDLNHHIHEAFTFDAEATTVGTPVEEVLRERRGVCQDFTHVMLGCLRSLGLAARYVSGYLRTHRPSGDAFVGADASHAWLSVFCPGFGWVDFDPTNDVMPGFEHITVAYGRDFADVSPVSGMIVGGGDHRVDVAVRVDPR